MILVRVDDKIVAQRVFLETLLWYAELVVTESGMWWRPPAKTLVI